MIYKVTFMFYHPPKEVHMYSNKIGSQGMYKEFFD